MNMNEWIPVAVSGASLAVSILALLRASFAERRSLADVKTQAFLTFRDRFNAIKRDLPPRWSDREWLPQPGTAEWRQIEAYWQNAFDEWFVCTRLNKEYLEKVWEVFFKRAVKSAVPNRPLRYVVWHLFEMGEFASANEDFKAVLEEFWGKQLKDPDFRVS